MRLPGSVGVTRIPDPHIALKTLVACPLSDLQCVRSRPLHHDAYIKAAHAAKGQHDGVKKVNCFHRHGDW